MTTELIPTNPENKSLTAELLAKAGQAANKAASAAAFGDYKSRKADNTLRRQVADLAAFESFLASVGVAVQGLAENPEAWRGVTWGLVTAFRNWMLQSGYAVSTANFRLSTVKVYAGLAAQAGVLSHTELGEIKQVAGFAHQEQRRIDAQREEQGKESRKGSKKAEAVSITPAQAKELKNRPNTPQGRRDALLMCLLLDHGLRCGEVARLTVGDFGLKAGELHFYRPKVDKVQIHKFTPATRRAADAYFKNDAPVLGPVWRVSASKAEGKAAHDAEELGAVGMSERAITKRVQVLGTSVGLPGLSAHDCRHYWATQAARHHTSLDRLQDAGGWNSLAMPARYIESAKIANEGINLGEMED